MEERLGRPEEQVAFPFTWSLGVGRPWLNGFIPVFGFVISTFSLSPIKQRWVGRMPQEVHAATNARHW